MYLYCLGIKCTNIFSKRFRVETSCKASGKRYVGVWQNNMTTVESKVLSPAKSDFTKVTFFPDFQKLNLEGWTNTHLQLIGKRAVDLAGTLHRRTKISLNGNRIAVASFKQYCQLYYGPTAPMVHVQISERWEVCVATSPEADFRQVSFVNALNTSSGGTHVDYLTNQIVRGTLAYLRRTNKNIAIKPAMIKQRLWVCVNSTIVNPSFSSQTKDELQTPPDDFGSNPQLPDSFVASVIRKKLLQSALEYADFAQSKVFKKTDGRKTRRVMVDKLEDANMAGSPQSTQCTLILTEGKRRCEWSVTLSIN
jgi:DNA topoisomerase-2